MSKRGRPAAARPAPATCTEGAEQIVLGDAAADACLAGKVWCQGGFDLRPRQPTGQHGQRVARVNHLGQRLAKEVGLRYLQNSQKSVSDTTIFKGASQLKLAQTRCLYRLQGVCRATSYIE